MEGLLFLSTILKGLGQCQKHQVRVGEGCSPMLWISLHLGVIDPVINEVLGIKGHIHWVAVKYVLGITNS
jgi:hypothetical protein